MGPCLSGMTARCILGGVDPDPDPPTSIEARQNAAGRAGFVLGCLAAILTSAINLARAPRPLSLGIVLLSLLIAALNIPLGIGLALLVERLSRSQSR